MPIETVASHCFVSCLQGRIRECNPCRAATAVRAAHAPFVYSHCLKRMCSPVICQAAYKSKSHLSPQAEHRAGFAIMRAVLAARGFCRWMQQATRRVSAPSLCVRSLEWWVLIKSLNSRIVHRQQRSPLRRKGSWLQERPGMPLFFDCCFVQR
eukprot:6184600-Pleurochrysis_carterae.AAC.2